MKKPKTLETKLRSALRLIWSRSSERRQIIKAAMCDCAMLEGKHFHCLICKKTYPDWAGEVDHEPPVGTLERWQDVAVFIEKMFFGPQRLVCKTCHRAKTKEQRRAKK